jgi:hypothetical protein
MPRDYIIEQKERSILCMDLEEWDLEWDGDGL